MRLTSDPKSNRPKERRPWRYRPLYEDGFLRTSPWLRSAGNQGRPLATAIATIALAAVAIFVLVALFSASNQPLLPSGHAVLIPLKGTSASPANGEGRLVWYQQGRLLVVTMTVRGLSPGSQATAELVARGSCSGSLPAGSRRVATATVGHSGLAQFNAELLGVSNLRFSQWALWVNPATRGDLPAACGVIKLAQPGQL